MKNERVWRAVAWTLAGLAMAASLNTWLSASRHGAILERKRQDLDHIRACSGRWTEEDALREWMEARQAWTPANLDALAAQTLGGDPVNVVLRPAVEVAPGWQRREAEVALPATSYAVAAAFLASCAEFAPAWRLRDMEITPSAEAGRGAMTFRLEALEKKQP
ncbi:MAG: hypothetical protein KBC66_02120 [Kiritimatiellae bacterium]|jgi:hypothetical protein|nr:hypothetical protein [Kiritimatiellia bacterium]NLD89884.1 hypothetical protein [Lentisphaerota bacterium]HOU21774.1 hypothetical protein [Kiritimatiellia bacterium]HPC18942.1 hypothetical protein [Kiritimatiellia bacterium]HQN80354.1 hypothetical protein [Kiritimatiellia bacterium]